MNNIELRGDIGGSFCKCLVDHRKYDSILFIKKRIKLWLTNIAKLWMNLRWRNYNICNLQGDD